MAITNASLAENVRAVICKFEQGQVLVLYAMLSTCVGMRSSMEKPPQKDKFQGSRICLVLYTADPSIRLTGFPFARNRG